MNFIFNPLNNIFVENLILEMLKRFFEGFITIFPFIYTDEKLIRYFPEDIYKNDWKNIGNDLKTILRKNERE